MEKEILPGLKYTFLAHVILGAITGLMLLLVPEIWASWAGQTLVDPVVSRLLGAAVLGYTASSWWAYREKVWDRVRIVVEAEMVWTILGTLVFVWGLLFMQLPALYWVNTLILAGFAIAFTYYYLRETTVTTHLAPHA
jgi:hypothetical protein